jgi:hypothetical protein
LSALTSSTSTKRCTRPAALSPGEAAPSTEAPVDAAEQSADASRASASSYLATLDRASVRVSFSEGGHALQGSRAKCMSAKYTGSYDPLGIMLRLRAGMGPT